jgi:hypothetical protein
MASFEARSKDSRKYRLLFIMNITNTVSRDAHSALLQGIHRNVELTREDIKNLAGRITTGPIDDSTTGPREIPLNPQREHFKDSTWWDPDQWQAIRAGSGVNDTDSSVMTMYMEDEHGKPIPSSTKTALRGDVYAYWTDLARTHPQDIRNYSELGLHRKEHFRETFEGRYPWLRLCSGHWKVDHLWMSYFKAWKRPRTVSPDPKTKESSPISTSAVRATSPPPPLGSKRALETEDSSDDPSKRRKARELILMAPTNFHHSRPQAKPGKQKAPAKMAKVRSPSLLFIIQHTHNM